MVNYAINEARDKMTEMLRDVEVGQECVITRHGKPIANVIPYKKERKFGTLTRDPIVDPDWDKPQEDIEAWLRGNV